MTVFDLVVVLLIANAVQNAMGPDVSVEGGVLAAAVLLAIDRIVSALGMRGRMWGRLLEGTPSVLVHDGDRSTASCAGRGSAELEMVMREHGVDTRGREARRPRD